MPKQAQGVNTAASSSLEVMLTGKSDKTPLHNNNSTRAAQFEESPSPLRAGFKGDEEQTTQDSMAHGDSESCDSAADDSSLRHSRAQPSPEALARIRQRNALYSKRKYYKRKQEVQRLERKRYDLQVSNQELRNENEELERLLQSVQRQIEQSLSHGNPSFPQRRQQSMPSVAWMPQPVLPAMPAHRGINDESLLRQRLLHHPSQQYAAAKAALLRGALPHPYHPLVSLPHSNILPGLPQRPSLNNPPMGRTLDAANPSDLVRLLGSTNRPAPNDPITSLLLDPYLRGRDALGQAPLPQYTASAAGFHAPNRIGVFNHASSSFMSANHRTAEQQLVLEVLQQTTGIPSSSVAPNAVEPRLLRWLQTRQRESLLQGAAAPNATTNTELLWQLLEQQERKPPYR
jgi:hypothetical protein